MQTGYFRVRMRLQVSFSVVLNPLSSKTVEIHALEVMPMPAESMRDVVGKIEPAVTMELAVAAWRQDLKLQSRTPLHSNRAVAAVAALAKTHGWTTPNDMRPEQLRSWLSEMVDRGLAARTRNTARGYLHRFAEFCKSQRWIAANPFHGVGRARIVRRQARYVPTEDEVVRLIAAAKKDRRTRDRWLVYLVAATTGLRWSTIKALQWSHVRLKAHPPRLELPGGLLKSREPGTVFLTAEVADHLRRHHAGHHQAASGPVFSGVPKWDGFQRDLKRAKIARGNEHDADAATFSPHSLRHFASNRMMWAGRFTDQERARQNTHQSVTMTTDVYTDPSHTALGEKVFAMQPLLPQTFTTDATRKTSAHPEKVLTKAHGIADNTSAQPQESNPKALSQPSATSDTKRLSPDVAEGTCEAPEAELPVDRVPANRGVPNSAIGVSGFEPLTPIGMERMLAKCLELLEMVVVICQQSQHQRADTRPTAALRGVRRAEEAEKPQEATLRHARGAGA